MADSTKKPFISQRYILSFLASFACALMFFMRTGLSVAIVAMVDKHALVDYNESAPDLCYHYKFNSSDYDSGYSGTYEWSESLQGIILGAYFYSYCLTQVLGGRLTERFGAKWICASGIFIPAILNAFIPVSADHESIVIILRVLIGAFHGLVLSALFAMYTKWFPRQEMIIPITLTMFGGNTGAVIVTPVTGYLCKSEFLDGWPSSFYLTSLLHVLWMAPWCWLVFNTPADDPRITVHELTYITENIISSNTRAKNKMKVPWKSILCSGPVWASIISKFTGSFGYFLLAIKMPKYLDHVFGMAIHTNGWFNSIMYLVMCVSVIVGGPLSSYIRIKCPKLSLTRIRKNFQIFSQVGSAVCLFLVPIVDCNKDVVIALLISGMFIYGFYAGGEYPIIPEYAPDLSGTIFGIANSIGVSTGFIGPLMVGLLLDSGNGDRHQWNTVWYLSGALNIFGAVVFEIFATAEPQEWAIINTDDKLENENK